MLSNEERIAEWRELLNDQRSSGLTVIKWCESKGLSENAYYYWRKRIVAPSLPESISKIEKNTECKPGWLAVPLNDSVPSSSLTLRVGRVSIDVSSGFDSSFLSNVLTVLEARC